MSRHEVSTKQKQIAENAKRLPEASFTALAHHMDKGWLHEAYRETRKDASPGIDGVTSEEYGENLEENLQSLLDRAKSGRYRAPAVKRVHIPKGKGKETRPLGLPTFEDKILQRAVKMILEPLYEQEFLDCSCGFRPGRSQHTAIKMMRDELTKMKGGWIIDIDIKKYFDSIDHRKLREIIGKRVCDGVITRLLGKWLNAGILENGELSYSKEGAPQGGVLSPLLSNIYLHEVLDRWFESTVKPRLKGKAFIIRYADDVIMGFQTKEDALRVYRVLPKRFAKYNLTLHPGKTRILCFRKQEEDGDKPETFNFLGFTHYWGKSRRGYYVIKHRTAKDRMARTVHKFNIWLKKNRHVNVREQHAILCRKLQGHYAYFGITSNYDSLYSLWEMVKRLWRKWLSLRSRKSGMNWEKFNLLLEKYPLTRPRVVHSIYAAKL
jgi:RNA-directed DNA polymerase